MVSLDVFFMDHRYSFLLCAHLGVEVLGCGQPWLFWLSLSECARKEERTRRSVLCGSYKVWPMLRMACLIQSSVTGLRAVLGSGQDGVLSGAVMSPYYVQDVAGSVI